MRFELNLLRAHNGRSVSCDRMRRSMNHLSSASGEDTGQR